MAVALVATATAMGIGACDSGPAPQQTAVIPGRTVDPSTPWSRGDFGAHAAASASPSGVATGPSPTTPGATGSGPALAATVDPEALDDLLRAVPTSGPAPTDPDGGTLIGSDTGTASTASPVTMEEPPVRSKKATVQLGTVAVQTDMASPAIEREARAQLYFPLVTKCRDKAGKILPPDAILLEFTINVEGYIVPQNISATATNPEHKAAAECMRRELSGLPFRGPPGARGQSAAVKMTVPSVD